MNPEALLRMLGIDPKIFSTKLDELIELLRSIDERLTRIEEKSSATHDLTEALHDSLSMAEIESNEVTDEHRNSC